MQLQSKNGHIIGGDDPNVRYDLLPKTGERGIIGQSGGARIRDASDITKRLGKVIGPWVRETYGPISLRGSRHYRTQGADGRMYVIGLWAVSFYRT